MFQTLRTREDDLTVSVGEIVQANTALLQQLARGFPRQILEAWDTWIKKIRHSNDGKLYISYMLHVWEHLSKFGIDLW